MKICFYEDEKFAQFYPLTLMRPVWALRSGIVPLFQRAARYFDTSNSCLVCREQIAPLTAENIRDYPINIIKREDGDILFLNGRLRRYGDLPKLVARADCPTRFQNGNETVALLLKGQIIDGIPPVATQNEYLQLIAAQSDRIAGLDTTATLYGHCWDLMADIETEIEADFVHLKPALGDTGSGRVHEGASLVNRHGVHLGEAVEVAPGAVIDASGGSVFIGANTRIESHAAIYGPCYIGPNCVVLAGKITASSIGHTCRVGGEVEESIFQSYVNKYHAGFIGHSYVGSWVNFGAMTTNSDLKNNYSNIRVSMRGEMIDTGSIKVGSFIGDHTKFGIGTLLNTGINVGVACNIFGGSLIADKEVGSFVWGTTGAYQPYRPEKALETARRTTERRDCRLSEREESLLQAIAEDRLSGDGIMEI